MRDSLIDACEIHVTGMGCVTPLGIGVDAFWQGLASGRSAVTHDPRFTDIDVPWRINARVDDFDGRRYVKPRKAIKVMCREIQFGYVAATMAIEQASGMALPDHPFDHDRIAVVYGAETFQGEPEELIQAIQKSFQAGSIDTRSWGGQALSQIQPLWMLKYLPNMAASHISIALDARGPNNTICQGDVSGALAIIEGADLLRRDWADLAIVGGTSSRVSPVGMLYRGAAQLSSRSADPTRAVRPFAADRDGNVHSEGAGAIVLDTPRRPGFDTSRSLGRLVGWARGFGDYRRPDFSEAIVAVARQALANAMVTVDDLSHINATGTSTMTGDWHEAVAIQALSSRTPVIAPSANIGNPGPSGSVLEIIASLAALRHQQLPPTLTGDIAPEFQMDLVRELRERRQENFLKLAFADTGQIAALVFAC